MRLRNYKIYLKKIKAQCRLMGLKIKWVKDMSCYGEYNPNKRTITIARNQSESEKISTLLHEMGHFIDDTRNPNRFAMKYHFHGYGKLEKEYAVLTVNQKDAVMRAEMSAWKNARALARQLKIPLGKWFYTDETRCLNTYRPIRTAG